MGIVVRKERPELEEQKDNLVINIAAGKKKLQELEDEILRYFNIFLDFYFINEDTFSKYSVYIILYVLTIEIFLYRLL